MRCIEIRISFYHLPVWFGLTLTWDVLKFIKPNINKPRLIGLTLTWDVLKWNLYGLDSSSKLGLTLTWDVLKWFCIETFPNIKHD